jgi:hypothetical protein
MSYPSAPQYRPPLHERIRLLGWLRSKLRRAMYRFLEKALATDDGRSILAKSVRGICSPRVAPDPKLDRPPYSGLGRPRQDTTTALRDDIVIITARFRSGSTLLWTLFRNVPGCTSYYEPFNERRWFDRARRGVHVDPTHHHAQDYWREYEGLEDLGRYYREEWTERHLFMDRDCYDPAMKRYVEILIEHAPGRPVLQFNRIDFRLPWFRHHFPRARLIHLYRHPRDQWCSTLRRISDFPKELGFDQFPAGDRYYLRQWARDLKYTFPFLAEGLLGHPYQMFYLIWKLSYLFGRQYAHYSLAFEDLVERPETCLPALLDYSRVTDYDLGSLKELIVPPQMGKWREFADEAWFQKHEAACEQIWMEYTGTVAERMESDGNTIAVPSACQSDRTAVYASNPGHAAPVG